MQLLAMEQLDTVLKTMRIALGLEVQNARHKNAVFRRAKLREPHQGLADVQHVFLPVGLHMGGLESVERLHSLLWSGLAVPGTEQVRPVLRRETVLRPKLRRLTVERDSLLPLPLPVPVQVEVLGQLGCVHQDLQ